MVTPTDDVPLFDAPTHPNPDRQECQRCGVGVVALDETLRLRGWIVYDGASLTGKPLRVRLCRACGRA